MSTQWSSDQRLLALGLTLTVASLFGAVTYSLARIRDSRKVTYPAPKPQYIDQSTEDALEESTLQILVNSHNTSISRVAQRIVVDRVVHDESAFEILIHDIASKDNETRERALRAVLLFDGGGEAWSTPLYYFRPSMSDKSGFLSDAHIPRLVKAVVIALTHSAAENAKTYQRIENSSDSDDFRDPTEVVALTVLAKLVEARTAACAALLQTHFVRDWLSKQNWGKSPTQRTKAFISHWNKYKKHSDNRISLIISKIAAYEVGVRQLMLEGLINTPSDLGIEGYSSGYSRFREENTWIFRDEATNTTVIMNTAGPGSGEGPALSPLELFVGRAVRAGEGEAVVVAPVEERDVGVADAAAATPPGTGSARINALEQSVEERRLRRRNREVMVLNDGDVPLGVGSIIDSVERSGD